MTEERLIMNKYVPSRRRVGEAGPQTSPELFTDDDIRAEIKYLLGLNKRHGSHPLRTAACTRLTAVLASRREA